MAQTRCALCGAKDVSEPRGEERYCRDCWDKKIAIEAIVAREFALKRYIRAHSAEKYLHVFIVEVRLMPTITVGRGWVYTSYGGKPTIGPMCVPTRLQDFKEELKGQ